MGGVGTGSCGMKRSGIREEWGEGGVGRGRSGERENWECGRSMM